MNARRRRAFRLLAVVLIVLISVGMRTALAQQEPPAPPLHDPSQILVAGKPAEIDTPSIQAPSANEGVRKDALPAPDRPSGMDYDRANRQLLMVSESAGALYVIDPGTGATVRTVSLPGASDSDPGSYGIAVVGKYWWHSDYQRGRLYQLDPSNGAILAARPMPSRYFGMAWDGRDLWGVDPGEAGDPESGRLYRIDLRTGDLLETVPLSNIDAPIDLTWDGTHLWVAERDGAELHRIDAHGNILQTETTSGPSLEGGGMAAQPPGVWVGNRVSNILQRVDLALSTCVAPSGLDVCALQPGDILVKTGPKSGDCGRRYRAVYNLGGTYFTHSALYLGRVADPYGDPYDVRPRIAEAQGPSAWDANEVWETWLSDTQFATGTCVTDWAVVRPKATAGAIQGAIAFARRTAAAPGVVFDMQATREDPKGYYCSKLVWKSYRDGSPDGPDLEADRGLGSLVFGAAWVTPDDLFYSSPVVQQMTVPFGQAAKRTFFFVWSQGHLTFMNPDGRWVEYDPATGNLLGEVPDAAASALPVVEVETTAAPAADAKTIAPPDFEAQTIAPPGEERTATCRHGPRRGGLWPRQRSCRVK
jgi:DNA-binding beta-propeller fold protein YncE